MRTADEASTLGETLEGGSDGDSGNGSSTGRQDALDNYASAVASGFYQRDSGGLSGKYDNVRRYWEDQFTRYVLHDFVGPVVDSKRETLSRLRMLDLGAGAGEGYEILTSLKKGGRSLASKEVDVLPPELLGCYKGIDVSEAMVQQGRKLYESNPKVEFVVGDLGKGLGPALDDAPYDVYFSSYGSLSHLRDEELSNLVSQILWHFDKRCVFVADLVGRYSFEWQCYWDAPGRDETNMRQYSMSYLYPPEMIERIEVERFPMRYWGADEFDEFIEDAAKSKGVRIQRRNVSDRSVLVGRHMDTGEFNRHAQPIREAVNCLHEFNLRTNLETLIFDYTPHANFPNLNEFFEAFQVAWNAVVYAAIDALENWDDPDWLEDEPAETLPDIVRDSIRTIRDVVRNIKWFRMGDPRANIFEPQLGYILRNLEMDLERGLGAGHGLLAIYELEKD